MSKHALFYGRIGLSSIRRRLRGLLRGQVEKTRTRSPSRRGCNTPYFLSQRSPRFWNHRGGSVFGSSCSTVASIGVECQTKTFKGAATACACSSLPWDYRDKSSTGVHFQCAYLFSDPSVDAEGLPRLRIRIRHTSGPSSCTQRIDFRIDRL